MDDNIIEITTSKFKKGCVVAKDIYSPSGQPIVIKGTVYSPNIKIRLLSYGITQLYVYNDIVIDGKEYKASGNSSSSASNSKEVKKKTNKQGSSSSQNNTSTKTSQNKTTNKIADPIPTATPSDDIPTKELPRDIQIQIDPLYKKYYNAYLKYLDEYKNDFTEMYNSNQPIDLTKNLKFPLKFVTIEHGKYNSLELLECMRRVDDPIFSHSYNTALVCGIIAKQQKMSLSDISVLLHAALLHDIGKFQIPKDLLESPLILSKEEFETLSKHTVKGYNLLKCQNLDKRIRECVLMHHERCDGSGYPNGLTSGNIPDFVKILSIADHYDSLLSSKTFQNVYNPFQIIEDFENNIEKFEAKFLIPFLHHIADSYINCEVLLNNGRLAKIIKINDTKLSKPLVSQDETYIDLSKDYSLSIIDII